MISCVLHYSDRPDSVKFILTESNCSSVTVSWIAPPDENCIPCVVELEYSYNLTKQITIRKILSFTTVDHWTVDNLKSDVVVNFSLKAVNSRGVKGPSRYGTVRTEPVGEDVIVHIYA